MKHPHHDLIAEWIKDTTRVVQIYICATESWIIASDPCWYKDRQYRLKPVPKPDVVHEYFLDGDGITLMIEPNLRLTFDGETGVLKSAKVLT